MFSLWIVGKSGIEYRSWYIILIDSNDLDKVVGIQLVCQVIQNERMMFELDHFDSPHVMQVCERKIYDI